MTGAELLAYIRRDVLRDSALPYLWSDALLYQRLSEAQEIHARRTYSIIDDTQEILTDPDQPTYLLPDGTMFVLSARLSTSSRDMSVRTRRMIPSHLLTSTGEPSVYTLDEATGVIRFYPVPDAVYTINTRVARLPSGALTSSATPEIPSRYHLDLAEYVAWRCLQDNDVDGSRTKASDRHRADWEMRLSDAKREFYRVQHGNNPNAVSSWTGKRN